MLALAVALLFAPNPDPHCSVSTEAVLELSPAEFDQNPANGWRALARRVECKGAAADLITSYRAAHGDQSSILRWHEGQLRATIGEIDRAIPLLDSSRHPPEGDFGWNVYVDATIAFLRGEKHSLVAARRRLASMPRPADSVYPPKLPWPMNLDVVDGLIACFGQPYSVAYGPACRPGGLQKFLETH